MAFKLTMHFIYLLVVYMVYNVIYLVYLEPCMYMICTIFKTKYLLNKTLYKIY